MIPLAYALFLLIVVGLISIRIAGYAGNVEGRLGLAALAAAFGVGGAMGIIATALNEGTPAEEPIAWLIWSLLLGGGAVVAASTWVDRRRLLGPRALGTAAAVTALAIPSTLTLALPLAGVLLAAVVGDAFVRPEGIRRDSVAGA